MDFQIRKDDLHETRMADDAAVEPGEGEAVLAVDSFGLTANNITYAVFGEAMSYWGFFPADGGWGRMPVWGFADVAESRADGLEDGKRIFGYYPPADQLLVRPKTDSGGFVETSEHRAALPAAYNRYSAVDAAPLYEQRYEDQQMLLWPLFFTSFLLDDFLGDEDLFGADTAVLSSASSRTASSAAHLLAKRDGIEVVGLTSPGNAEFVESLGVYDAVVAYGDAEELPGERAVYADMSGDAGIREAVHRRYGDALVHDAVVGATHHGQMTPGDGSLPGPKPAFFFAPDRLRKRAEDWGREGLDERVAAAWRPYVEWTGEWLEIEHHDAAEAIERIYIELLDGGTDPAVGHVLRVS